MAYRRILYCGALAGAFLFQITNDNYLAHFLLVLCLALPLLSLALSLPGMAACRLALSAQPQVVPRGEEGCWLLTAGSATGLPLPRVTLRLTERDLHSGRVRRERLILSGVVRRKPSQHPADTGHCALLELQADKARVSDYLGLFFLPVPAPRPARMVVEPVAVDPGVLELPEQAQGCASPHAPTRKGLGEDYELREYQPGDPMRSVHWKLSSKWDELIVRSPADTAVPMPLITFDHVGPPEELDKTLDRVLGVCRALLRAQRPHGVLWLSKDGQGEYRDVSDEGQLHECLLAILSCEAPETGPSILDRPELITGRDGPVFHLHVTAGEEGEHD